MEGASGGMSCWSPFEHQAFLWWHGEKGGPNNKSSCIDFKKPSEINLDEFKSLPAKYNWSSQVKFSLNSINNLSADAPIRLCHLLMVVAWRLKFFGDDAFGKVAARCKVGASIINHLMEKILCFIEEVLLMLIYQFVWGLWMMKHSKRLWLNSSSVPAIKTCSVTMSAMVRGTLLWQAKVFHPLLLLLVVLLMLKCF